MQLAMQLRKKIVYKIIHRISCRRIISTSLNVHLFVKNENSFAHTSEEPFFTYKSTKTRVEEKITLAGKKTHITMHICLSLV